MYPDAPARSRRAKLPLRDLAEALGDLALPRVAAVKVDESGACAAVAHPVHQLAERCPGARRQSISGVPEIVKVNAGQIRGRERREPLTPPKVVVPQRCAGGVVNTSASGSGAA